MPPSMTHNETLKEVLKMKRLFCAFIITIQFFVALGCVGGFENGTMSFGWCVVGSLVSFAIMYVCFCLIEREEKKDAED